MATAFESDQIKDFTPPTKPTPTELDRYRPQSTVGWAYPQSSVSPKIRPATAIGWNDRNKRSEKKCSIDTREDSWYYLKDKASDMGGKQSSEIKPSSEIQTESLDVSCLLTHVGERH